MSLFRQGNNDIHNIHGIAPSQRADGSPLPIGNISHYIQFLSFNGGVPLESAVSLIDGAFGARGSTASEDIDIDNTEAGLWEYWYQTVDMGGRRSIDSDKARLEILPPFAMPNPPTGISVV